MNDEQKLRDVLENAPFKVDLDLRRKLQQEYVEELRNQLDKEEQFLNSDIALVLRDLKSKHDGIRSFGRLRNYKAKIKEDIATTMMMIEALEK